MIPPAFIAYVSMLKSCCFIRYVSMWVGTNPQQDELIYEGQDDTFYLGLGKPPQNVLF
jgi:protease II